MLPHKKISILVVDDELSIRESLSGWLQQDGYEVESAADGPAALAKAQETHYDIMLLDVKMPRMDGITVLKKLRESNADTAVVVMTAHGAIQDAVEAMKLGAHDYLLKPFDDARFRATMERVRRRHAADKGFDRSGALTSLLDQLERSAAARAESQPRVLAEAGSRMHMLDVAQVEVVEADRNYVRLVIGRDTFHARSTLQQAEKSFTAQPMLRISRSCLVNMRHVREVSRTPRGDFILVVAGGTTITSSEGFREPVRQYLEKLKLAPA